MTDVKTRDESMPDIDSGLSKDAGDVIEIICIVDRSGSMGLIRDDAIGAFNTFLQKQKEAPGAANLTLVLFNHEYEIIYDNVPLNKIEPLTNDTYVPSGTTALLDAIGRTLDRRKLGKKGIVMILTDGAENASKDYKKAKIEELTTELTQRGWEIHFGAANVDAFAESVVLGLANAKAFNYASSGAGIGNAYRGMTSSALSYRAIHSSTGDAEFKAQSSTGDDEANKA